MVPNGCAGAWEGGGAARLALQSLKKPLTSFSSLLLLPPISACAFPPGPAAALGPPLAAPSAPPGRCLSPAHVDITMTFSMVLVCS